MLGHTDEAPKNLKNLWQLPRSGSSFHRCMDFSGKYWAKSVPPKANRLMANINATLMQQILHISKRKRKPEVHHHRKADDFGRRLEVAKWAAFCHPPKLRGCPARLNQFCSDSATLPAPLCYPAVNCPRTAVFGGEILLPMPTRA